MQGKIVKMLSYELTKQPYLLACDIHCFFFPFFLATFNETHHPPLPVSPLHSVPAVSRILSLVPVVSYLDTPKTAGVVLLSEVLCANIFHCILKVLNVILKKYINFNESYFIIYLHKIILHALLRSKF